MTKDELELPIKVFKAIDKDSDGELSYNEVMTAFQKHCQAAVQNGEVDTIFKRVNVSKSGCIEFSEFLSASLDSNQLFTAERISAAFKMIAKSDNVITFERVKDALSTNGLTPPSDADIHSMFPKNTQGRITLDHFTKMINPKLT